MSKVCTGAEVWVVGMVVGDLVGLILNPVLGWRGSVIIAGLLTMEPALLNAKD